MTFDHVTPEWIKSKLIEHKLKQKALVEAIGADKATVSRWLNGKTPMGGMAKAAVHYFFQTLN